MNQIRYISEQKLWSLEQMKPPLSRTVVELTKETSITAFTLRTWREAARQGGHAYLPVKGCFFYCYMGKDMYSRKLVANEVHEAEASQQASQLLHKACLREQTAGRPLVPDSGNGSDLLMAMQALGVVPSYSRPRVSNDTPTPRPCSARPNAGRFGRASLRQRAAGQAMGAVLCGLAQRRASPRRVEVRNARPASQKAGSA
nr:hypothetical protein [Comamonas testosteroni]